jgi:D-glycerate 3-kinase
MDRETFWSFLHDWMLDAARAHPADRRPFIVGLSAPQGAGKSTTTARLCQMAADAGVRAATVSVDDFYLTRDELLGLAARHSDNPYFRHRGYPGTHDVELGTKILRALQRIHSLGMVDVPVYDRSAFMGQGDRRPRSEWQRITAPLDIVIFEGWLLGFRAVLPGALPNEHFIAINDYLSAYSAWLAFLDAFIWLEPVDPHFVIEWRIEAE